MHFNTVWQSSAATEYYRYTTHTRLMALFQGLPRWAGTKKEKPIWILLKKETVSGSGISWTICKSAPCSRQPWQHSPLFFTGRMPFLPPNQPCQRMGACHKIYKYPCHCVQYTYPSTATSSIQRKLSSGRTKGGPRSTCGCWDVYWLKQTSAVSLFCRHKNLQTASQKTRI